MAFDGKELEKNKKVDSDSFGAVNEDKKESIEAATDAIEQKAEAQSAIPKRKKSAIKTYKDYASEELRKGGGTLTNMILQEREKKKERTRNSAKNTKNIFIIFLTGLFVLAGLAIVVFSFFLAQQKQEDNQIKNSLVVAPSPLVINDFRKEIYIPSPSRGKIIREIVREREETSIPLGTIKHVYFVEDDDVEIKKLTDTQSFFQYIQTDIPTTLVRTLQDVFMYGFYSTTDVSPFLILQANSYNTAYAAMLEWERSIIRDLEEVFDQDYSDAPRIIFEDVVIYNTDVRALLDQQGEIIFGYAFLQDKSTLIIFENKLTLREIITRNQRNTVKQ